MKGAKNSQNGSPNGSIGKIIPDSRSKKRAFLSHPVKAVQIKNDQTVADLLEQMQGMSIQARNLGICASVLKKMLSDPGRPTIFLGLAGPLIAAGLRKVIRDLIAQGAVDVVVSTGAILYQDIYQARGAKHYQGSPDADDEQLRQLRINRIYDTYVDEEQFWETDHWCAQIAEELEPRVHSSREFLKAAGSKLSDPDSIVRTCYELGIPIFSPALNDSSIGIGLTEHYHKAVQERRTPASIDSIRDNYEISQIAVQSPKTAAIFVAGGVPKNYINDAVVMSYLFGEERSHSYAIQLTTAVTADGGLSGSTFSEARTWGKVQKDADFAMAWVEPSVSLPLLASYVLNRQLSTNRSRLQYQWRGEILESLQAGSPKRPSPKRSRVTL